MLAKMKAHFIPCLAFALAAALFLNASIGSSKAFANDGGESEDNLVLFDESAAKIAANNLATSLFPDEDVTASSAVAFLNSFDEKGYIVNFTRGSDSYGYVVLDPCADNLLVECSLGSNVLNPYEAALLQSGEVRACDDGVLAVIQLGPFEYGVVSADSSCVQTNYGGKLSVDECVSKRSANAKDPGSWAAASVAISDLYKNYTITAAGNLPEWVCTTQEQIISMTGRYACSVTAYYAIAGYYHLLDPWSDAQAYIDIWNYTGTTKDPNNSDDSILWGSTNIDNGAAGFVSYLATRGKTVTQRTTSGKPAFEEYITSVSNQDASVMHGWMYNNNGIQVGHTMFVEGYFRALSKSDYSGLRILQVFDGWYSSVRYINYDYANYSQFRGTFFVD